MEKFHNNLHSKDDIQSKESFFKELCSTLSYNVAAVPHRLYPNLAKVSDLKL